MWNHRICMRSEPTLQHHSHDSPSCGDVYFLSFNKAIDTDLCARSRAPSQYPKRRLFVRSRKVSKPRDLYLELPDRSEIWQALRQQCCRCACQISKRYGNLKYQSRGFETLRDLTKRRLSGYSRRRGPGIKSRDKYLHPTMYVGCNHLSLSLCQK